MAKLKFNDIVVIARATRTTEGIIPIGQSYRVSALDNMPVDPQGEIECIAIYGRAGALSEFDILMRETHGHQFKWARDTAGIYLRLPIERVEF